METVQVITSHVIRRRDGGKMSKAQELEHLRRQKVLKDLNCRLKAGVKDGLSITGRGIIAQGIGVDTGPTAKPSRIPTPERTSRPLPSFGYVAESISLHHTPRQHPPPNEEIPSITTFPHPAPKVRHTKTLTVEIVGITTNKKQLSKASQKEEYEHSLSQRSTTVKPNHSMRKNRGIESKKKETIKSNTTKKHGAVIKQTRMHALHKEINPWGSEGRLNELRIRYLARKYYRLWCRHTYGRVLPSDVKIYRECALKRRAMAAWREIWWVARREWKLNIRAECHNRYRIWQKVWSVWTEFVRLSKCKKKKKVMAKSFASRRLLSTVWKGWSKFMLIRTEKKEMEVRVKQWSDMRMKRTSWNKWKSSLVERRQLSSMNILALHHWAFQLQRRVLYSWLQTYHEKVLLRQRAMVASQHWRRKVICGCLKAWLTYISWRRVKHQMRGVASEHHNLVVTMKTFSCWKRRHLRARQLADFHELVSVKGKLATLRRAMWQWKFYIKLEQHKQYLKEVASQLYSLTIKSKVLYALKAYVSIQQKQAVNNHLAQQFHVKQRLRHCWAVWLQRCEHCEEIKLGPKTRSARAHHVLKLKRLVIVAWLQYTGRRLERKKLYSQADQHFKAVALPRCFAAMKRFVSIRCHQKQLKDHSSSFRRETLLSMAFYRWWREATLSQDVRMLERVAILHSEEVSKKKLLKLWKFRTQERIQQHGNQQKAVAHHYYTVLEGVFQTWRQRYQTSIRVERQVRHADEHCEHRLVGLAWTAWTKYVEAKRLAHCKKMNAIKKHDKNLLRNTLNAWKTHHSSALEKKAKNCKVDLIYQSKLKRKALASWCKGIQTCQYRQRLLQQATSFNKLSLLSKHFSTWRERTANAIDQNQAENELLQRAAVRLKHLKLVRMFCTWKQCVELSKTERRAEELAEFHHCRSLLVKCFSIWYDYHRVQLRKSLLQRQGQWFEQNRLLSLTYSKWRVQLMHTLVFKKKNSMALWHWSQTLERKVLTGWLFYALQKKRKRERYSKAMERHRKRLITIGVRQWIRVSCQVQMQREETAMQQQLNTTQAVMSCARKCALHWRRIARERRLKAQAVSGQVAAMLLPHQACGQANKPHVLPPSSDLWNNIARQLKIPDGMRPSRPQPRKAAYLSHSPFPSDIVPRVPSHPPPTPHPDAATTARTNDTFLFHLSSCSETEIKSRSSPAQKEHNNNIALESASPGTLQHEPNVISAGVYEKDGGQLNPRHRSSLITPRNTSLKRFQRDTLTLQAEARREASRVQYKSSAMPCTVSKEGVTGEVDLSNPSVQMEIVQMRDELKRFHDLKVHRKQLEAELAARLEHKDGETVTEVEEELMVISEKIEQCAPVVHIVASKVQQLLSQSST